jgi:hypothetical protein
LADNHDQWPMAWDDDEIGGFGDRAPGPPIFGRRFARP